MKKFYRYITKERGGYRIRKNGIYYGWYNDLSDALYDRDNLEKCDWDIEEWVWLPDTPNKYKKMDLPPIDIVRERQYIYKSVSGNWYIRKQIDGVKKYFGTFKTLEEAIKERNRLMKEGWEQ